MTKEQLCKEISRRTGLHISQVELTVEHFQRAVVAALGNGDNVVLQGFGRFHVVQLASRRFTSIHGNPVTVPPKYTARFKAHTDMLSYIKHKRGTPA